MNGKNLEMHQPQATDLTTETPETLPVASPDARASASETPDESPEELRRRFLKRFGVYAATAPLVTFTLMSPRTSKAIGSDTGPG